MCEEIDLRVLDKAVKKDIATFLLPIYYEIITPLYFNLGKNELVFFINIFGQRIN